MVQGIEQIYLALAAQIEQYMEIFVSVTLEMCFTATNETLEQVQRRRSTTLLEPKEPAEEHADREEIAQLLRESRKVSTSPFFRAKSRQLMPAASYSSSSC